MPLPVHDDSITAGSDSGRSRRRGNPDERMDTSSITSQARAQTTRVAPRAVRRGLLLVLVALGQARVLACAPFSATAGDGLTDSSMPDVGAGATSDGGGDAGRWCDSLTPAPIFCTDFDGDEPFGGWSSPSVTDG